MNNIIFHYNEYTEELEDDYVYTRVYNASKDLGIQESILYLHNIYLPIRFRKMGIASSLIRGIVDNDINKDKIIILQAGYSVYDNDERTEEEEEFFLDNLQAFYNMLGFTRLPIFYMDEIIPMIYSNDNGKKILEHLESKNK